MTEEGEGGLEKRVEGRKKDGRGRGCWDTKEERGVEEDKIEVAGLSSMWG